MARALLPLLMPVLMKMAMNPEQSLGRDQRYAIDRDAPATADPLLR